MQDARLLCDWDRLNALRGNLPFLAGDAMACALKVFGDGGERLLVAREESRVVAMFLLVAHGRFRWKTFQPSQIPLGAWVAEADIPLLDLARSLLRGPIGFCLVLSITQIDPRLAPRGEDARDCLHSNYIETGWIDIQGSFDAYWNARGKNLRQNMRKQRSKLMSDGIRLRMNVHREHSEMAPAIQRYGVLESAGWKAGQGTAIHPDNAQGRFYRELFENASRRGEAVIYEYLFDNRVVAMNLCLERDGVLVVLKTTYDESISSYSPAFLLRQEELEAFHRDGNISRLEYFGRMMEWHTRWTDTKRTIYHLTVYRWPMVKTLAKARGKMPHAAMAVATAETISTKAAKGSI
jgi:CelD/BcsL family acetyltransferase involved in cellulose biosynthesis